MLDAIFTAARSLTFKKLFEQPPDKICTASERYNLLP